MTIKDEAPMNTDLTPAFPTGSCPQVRSAIMTRSCTGTTIRPPDKLNLGKGEMWHVQLIDYY